MPPGFPYLPPPGRSSKVPPLSSGSKTTRILLSDLLLARLPFGFGKDRRLNGPALQKILEREGSLLRDFSRRMPHTPLIQQRSGQDDSALRSAGFADLEAHPRRLVPTDNPAVVYVQLAFHYRSDQHTEYELNLGRIRVWARIEDPLYLRNRSHSVEQVRNNPRLREEYFRKVFGLLNAQSECNRELGEWMSDFLLPASGPDDRDFLATIQNFNHNIGIDHRRSTGGREPFRTALTGFDFAEQTPRRGPVALRLSMRPNQRTDGLFGQSVTSVLLGTRRGLAFRRNNGKVVFIPPGNAFEARFSRLVSEQADERLSRIARNSYRKTAEERIWGAKGECEAYFHNHDRFIMKGVEWTLEREGDNTPRVMGSHRNVATYCSGRHRVAVKAVPFESVGDLVRLVQTHQYVHGVQAGALLAQAKIHPRIRSEIMATVSSMLSARDQAPFADAQRAWKVPDRELSGRFTRNIGPLLHQVTVDYENKLMLTVLDWSAQGMLSDLQARKRLLEDCSLSHRLRMAANLMRNGHQLLADDVTHTDLKPENILNLPGAAFRAQQKARIKGWDSLDDADMRDLAVGEPILEGDFSGIHFGREGGIDNLAPGEGLPTSINYSSWRFTSIGLSEGTQPSVLRKRKHELPPIDALVLEQDIANRGATAWEIVYGSLVDCIPPAEEQRRIVARRTAEVRVAKHLDHAIRLRREGKEDPAVLAALDTAMEECDRRLLDLVSLRSETIDNKTRLSPLYQHARDNRHGVSVWLDTRVIEMLDHLACDFRRRNVTRQRVAKLYRTAETLLRAEATRLEVADRHIARNRRLKMVTYMNTSGLHLNADCGLLGLSDLPRQLERVAELVTRMPDPRRALAEFAQAWQAARQWGATAVDALVELHAAQRGTTVTDDNRGRKELHELVRETLLKEHRSQVELESRADEPQIRPPFLGLFERRRTQVCEACDEVSLSHTLDVE